MEQLSHRKAGLAIRVICDEQGLLSPELFVALAESAEYGWRVF